MKKSIYKKKLSSEEKETKNLKDAIMKRVSRVDSIEYLIKLYEEIDNIDNLIKEE